MAALIRFAGFVVIDIAEMDFDPRKPHGEPIQQAAHFAFNEMLQGRIYHDGRR